MISDFLVIGSGIAGLFYALEVADKGTVTVLCKGDPTEGNTQYAQGGIASVTSPLDSFDAHIKDTLIAGAELCHKDIVEMVVKEGPERIKDLISLGTDFDREPGADTYHLGQEGGHSARRILHTRDATGAEIVRALYQKAYAHPNIKILPYHVAIDLIVEKENDNIKKVIGCYALDAKTNSVHSFGGRITMLATGGLGKVYLYTSNPDIATGDGVAMAYRAGAKIANMEFIQFHPTCLFHPKAKSFLITEAMRGEGAVLKTIDGKEFMHRYDKRKELAPRDIVARAIDDVMKRSGDDYVLLDISHREPDFIRSHFPTIYERVKGFGYDITKEPIPVVPAAHYCCGGVLSDKDGKTSLKNLYVSGEAASTGLHGANRLASNSLLEALVFAHRAAIDSISNISTIAPLSSVPSWDYVNAVESKEEILISHAWDEVRRTMWNLVGIVRSNHRIDLAKKRLSLIRQEITDYYWRFLLTSDLIELRNIIENAELITACASLRKESRGLHYNVDYPEADDVNWLKDTIVCK